MWLRSQQRSLYTQHLRAKRTQTVSPEYAADQIAKEHRVVALLDVVVSREEGVVESRYPAHFADEGALGRSATDVLRQDFFQQGCMLGPDTWVDEAISQTEQAPLRRLSISFMDRRKLTHQEYRFEDSFNSV